MCIRDRLNKELADKWTIILAVRAQAVADIANFCENGFLKSSLDAHVQIHCSSALAKQLQSVDMAELTVTSKCTVLIDEASHSGNAARIVILKAEGNRCARSRKLSPSVGADEEFPDLSARDVKVVRARRVEMRESAARFATGT